MRKKVIGSLTALLFAGGLVSAGTAMAGTTATATATATATVNPVCKTVFVTTFTAPVLNVNVGNSHGTVDVSAMVAKSVTVCVGADAALQSKVALLLDAPKVANGAVTISGNIYAMAGASGNVAVSVQVSNGDHSVCKELSFPVIPVSSDYSQPIFIAAGDP
ncbi:MAG TPA: hypothetical protein VFJ85_00980 [Acidimicrobiales bacterium]|nr:hypothetical protein [Acidimicrobiales bacterium]